jgi:TolB-like protein/Tfp pilus assembly protein PilF
MGSTNSSTQADMSLIKELKRRNVVKVAIAYAVAAWLLIEIATTTFPVLTLPDWSVTLVTVLVLIGFPLALIFAWAFELTPEGLKKEKHVDRSESITHLTGRKFDFAIIGLLALALVFVVVDNYVLRDDPAPGVSEQTELPVPPLEKSIAVLPFANRSASQEDVFFVDGLHDDLLTHISKIGSIKTISRTSVMQYRDTDKTIPQIAEELGVATIMEGGVQRAGDTIRINVQLIDAANDEHLWAQTYDRQLTAVSIFAIQSEIATAIAEELRATLSLDERQELATVPTESLPALEAYFLGKQKMEKRTTVALAEAVEYFSEAIALDPDFALAYVGLADTYRLQANYSGFPRDEMDAKGKAAIDRALQLNDRLGEAYASLANLRQRNNDFEGAEAAFKRALELAPNYAPAYQWFGEFLSFRVGRPADALPLSRKAVELDPLSAIIVSDYAEVLTVAGRLDEAVAQYEKAIEIDSAFAIAYSRIGVIHWRTRARLDEAISWIRKSFSLDPGRRNDPAALGLVYLDLGDICQAQSWIDRSMELSPEFYTANFAMALLHFNRGEKTRGLKYARKLLVINSRSSAALALLAKHDLKEGRYAEARGRYEQSYPALLNDSEPQIDRSNYEAAIDLAFVLSSTSEQDRANLLLDRSLTYVHTMPEPGWYGYRIDDVRIFAQLGKKEKALAALRRAVDQGWRAYWWYYLEHDLSLASIRNDPRFQAMVKEIKADMAEQLARVREWEANGELAPIPKASQ